MNWSTDFVDVASMRKMVPAGGPHRESSVKTVYASVKLDRNVDDRIGKDVP